MVLRTNERKLELRHVKRPCHRAPLHFLLWRYTSFIAVLHCIVDSAEKENVLKYLASFKFYCTSL